MNRRNGRLRFERRERHRMGTRGCELYDLSDAPILDAVLGRGSDPPARAVLQQREVSIEPEVDDGRSRCAWGRRLRLQATGCRHEHNGIGRYREGCGHTWNEGIRRVRHENVGAQDRNGILIVRALRPGRPSRAGCSRRAGRPLDAVVTSCPGRPRRTSRTSRTSRTCCTSWSLLACRTLRSGGALQSSGALRTCRSFRPRPTLRPFRTCRTCGTLWSRRARGPSSAWHAGNSGYALCTGGATGAGRSHRTFDVPVNADLAAPARLVDVNDSGQRSVIRITITTAIADHAGVNHVARRRFVRGRHTLSVSLDRVQYAENSDTDSKARSCPCSSATR